MSVDRRPSSGHSSLIRADGLWFHDCGLVIQAESTIFRVSGGFLGTHSPIFRDMLSLPMVHDVEMIEGCPLVRLPDTAQDVTIFLKALIYYDFFEPSPAPTTFEILSAVLRMADKYQVAALRKRAGYEDQLRAPNLLVGGGMPFTAIVTLARQFSFSNSTESAIIQCSMTVEDKTRFVIGRRVLEVNENSKIIDFLWSPMIIDGCKSSHACVDSKLTCRSEAEDWRREPPQKILLPLDLWDRDDWARLDVCGKCLPVLKQAHRAALASFWNRLPQVFDLPDWSELDKMKAEALA
ncbi:hypothetical protein GGX14DRAFT_466877 [Mycena pura]|uniref:BTB domain-containing protein n=1 Tax=Mycena pura TaxID=153505 RepID=A0AAD6Y756_9AGAR|nr:hypothetical protein GGX14DRAFT_466877 [Mycena pura]